MGNSEGSCKTMKNLGLLLSLILAVSNAKVFDDEWESFKRVWGKDYPPAEDSLRHGLWKINKALVEKQNKKEEKSFTLALNEASDWTAEEVKSFRLGYIDLDEGEGKTFPERDGRPDLLDHREAGLVTEVKGQGSCGSCWAFSATGGIEGVWALKVGELVSMSEQQLLDCAPGSCNGGNMGPAWDNAKDGIMSEEDYPYERKEGECRYNRSQAVASVTGHESVAHNEYDLEKALYQIGYPISIAVHAGSSFQHYKEGVYNDPECVEGKLNHAVLLVGYNKTAPEPYWIVKNSWGKSWGQHGYIHMKMGENNCGLAKRPVYPLLDIYM